MYLIQLVEHRGQSPQLGTCRTSHGRRAWINRMLNADLEKFYAGMR